MASFCACRVREGLFMLDRDGAKKGLMWLQVLVAADMKVNAVDPRLFVVKCKG